MFKAQREFAEATSKQWYILSAKYWLVRPDQQIRWYNQTLKGKPVHKKKAWAQKVFVDLQNQIAGSGRIVITAGEDYSRYLVPLLEREGHKVYRPLKGVSFGFRIRRLRALTKKAKST